MNMAYELVCATEAVGLTDRDKKRGEAQCDDQWKTYEHVLLGHVWMASDPRHL